MNNLATVLQDQGHLDAARDLYEQVLAARRRLLGEDHPDTLTSANNLAAILHRRGDTVAARALQEHVLAAIAAEQAVEGGVMAALGEATRHAGSSQGPGVPEKSPEGEHREVSSTPQAVIASQSPDADLVERVRKGDGAAWNALIEHYAPLVMSVVRRHRLGPADTEDVTQSVWLQLVDDIEALREPEALPGWLETTTRRECLRVERTSERAAGVDFRGLVEPLGLDTETQNATVRDALEQLPERCRQLLLLLVEDPPLSYSEISRSLGIAIGSLGPQRARCLARLRALLDEANASRTGGH